MKEEKCEGYQAGVRRKGTEEVLKRNLKDGIEYLTFPKIEETGIVNHLFTTRSGGVSEGIFATMNLSYTRGDKREAVDANFRKIAELMGSSPENFVCSDQTHTTNVRKVTLKDRGKGVVREKDYRDVDGLITDEPGIVLATFYADCVPLFIVDARHKAIGLSHSGWRGTAGRMGRHTLQAMKEAYGTEPADVTAAIGPSICGDCYEVGGEVAEAFQTAFSEAAVKKMIRPRGNGKFLLDLWQANYEVFAEAGVSPDRISVTDLCTCCNPDYLFSHRASGGKRGNMGAFMSLY